MRNKMKKDRYHQKVVEYINKYFFQGAMSTLWYRDIEVWFKEYAFDEQIMIELFNYCFDKCALYRSYIKTVANEWRKNNIKTFEDLENYKKSKGKQLDEECKKN